MCAYVDNIGKGICYAGDGSGCAYVDNIGHGICEARKGTSCRGMSIERALALPVVDTDWEWDQFREPNSYQRMWGCRGTSSGQFADDWRCAGKARIDRKWPNN